MENEDGEHRRTTEEKACDPADGAGAGQGNYFPQAIVQAYGADPARNPGDHTGVVWVSYQGIFAKPLTAAFTTVLERPPLEDTGIEMGEIEAWRAWKVTGKCELQSIAMNTLWRPGEPMTGNVEDHNGEGVYCFKTKDDMREEFGTSCFKTKDGMREEFGTSAALSYLYLHIGGHVYGRVKIWGDMVEHRKGYRAQYAKIIALDEFCYNIKPSMIHAVCANYGMPAPEIKKPPRGSTNFSGAGLALDRRMKMLRVMRWVSGSVIVFCLGNLARVAWLALQ